MDQMQQKRRVSYENASIPYGKVCLKLGLTPNVLTFISFMVSIGAAVLYWQRFLLLGAVATLVTMLADMLDGATARAGNCGTKFGGILDHVSDRYAEAVILMGVAASGFVNPFWAMFALFGMIIASYTREAAESQGKIENVAVGAVGRVEKLIILMLGSVTEYLFPGYDLLMWALIVMGAASYMTSFQRLVYAKKILDEREKNL
jgi:phosphatidylglycerophosphate synthase